MIVKQKYVHWIRLGIAEANFSGDLEVVCRGLTWVRHDAVRHLECIDIGLVFEVAAYGVSGNVGDKSEDGEN